MDNPPPSLGALQIEHTEKREGEVQDQVKTEASSSKLVGKKRRPLENKMIMKKVKKMAAKVAHMRTETSNLRAEMGEMGAAAEEKESEVKLEKKKRDGCLAEMLLISVTEHALMEILFPPSEDD